MLTCLKGPRRKFRKINIVKIILNFNVILLTIYRVISLFKQFLLISIIITFIIYKMHHIYELQTKQFTIASFLFFNSLDR